MSEKSDDYKMDEKIIEKLDYLERRVGQLESLLGIRKVSE